MFKKGISLLILLYVSFSSFAYDYTNMLMAKKKKKNSGFDKTRILLGPGVGFGAGYRSFFFNLSPSVAYAFTENFYAGITTSFSYYQSTQLLTNAATNLDEPYKFKTPIYAGSIYLRYIIANRIILNVEPEINNTKTYTSYYTNPQTKKIVVDSYRLTIPAFIIGAGYCQRFGNYSHSFLMAGYDINQNPNSRYYQTLDIRAGLMISLFN